MARNFVHVKKQGDQWAVAHEGRGRPDSTHRTQERAISAGRRVAKKEGSQMKDTAKDQARQVKDEAAAQARGLVDQAKTELRDQGKSQADHVAHAIRRVGDQADALAEGRPEDAGAVADYVRQAGD